MSKEHLANAALVLFFAAVLGGFIYAFVAIPRPKHSPVIAHGKLISNSPTRWVLLWCESHIRISDELWRETFELVPVEDGKVQIERHYQRLGICYAHAQ